MIWRTGARSGALLVLSSLTGESWSGALLVLSSLTGESNKRNNLKQIKITTKEKEGQHLQYGGYKSSLHMVKLFGGVM